MPWNWHLIREKSNHKFHFGSQVSKKKDVKYIHYTHISDEFKKSGKKNHEIILAIGKDEAFLNQIMLTHPTWKSSAFLYSF